MTHAARKLSETGYYHVVSKGDGGQIIFEDDKDRVRFMAELARACEEHAVETHAYCLMDNHVHLLVEDANANLSAFMKALNERYAVHYRRKTGRTGHVFQARFWSEPIDTDAHFLAVLRYIHANPEQAGMCSCAEYPWSSYASYLWREDFVETGIALALLESAETFEEFHGNCGCFAKPYRQSGLTRHLSYDELLRVAVNLLGRETLNSLKGMAPAVRVEHLRTLTEAGFNETQIARLTGIGQAAIYRNLRKPS